VAELKKILPEDAGLVSFGTENSAIDHLFAYYWGKPIRLISWPPLADQPAPEFEYFCFMKNSPGAQRIDFRWEKVTEICCDRVHSNTPQRVVVVGRRIGDSSARSKTAILR
jgi:hypothetical protein